MPFVQSEALRRNGKTSSKVVAKIEKSNMCVLTRFVPEIYTKMNFPGKEHTLIHEIRHLCNRFNHVFLLTGM